MRAEHAELVPKQCRNSKRDYKKMGRIRTPFSIEINKSSDGSTNVDIELLLPRPNTHYHVTSIMGVDKTTGFTSITFFSGNITSPLEIEQTLLPNVNERIVYNATHIVVKEGERMFIRFTGTTNSDVLTVNCWGYLVRFEHAHR